MISIHALLAESDSNGSDFLRKVKTYFYPRSPCGERQPTPGRDDENNVFLSTLSLRRATSGHDTGGRIRQRFLSTLSLRRATCVCWMVPSRLLFLSTLSLRRATGGTESIAAEVSHFYPRSPCGERQPTPGRDDENNVFLSTLSLRRATKSNKLAEQKLVFLSTLSLRRATVGQNRLRQKLAISIHALLAESDSITIIITCIVSRFLSTLSLRRATLIQLRKLLYPGNFYPRSPCGERQDSLTDDVSTGGFLSTLSLRRATPLR